MGPEMRREEPNKGPIESQRGAGSGAGAVVKSAECEEQGGSMTVSEMRMRELGPIAERMDRRILTQSSSGQSCLEGI